MVFIGLPWSVIPFPLFYIQALVACSVMNNPSLLPSQLDMREWLKDFELSKSQVDGNEVTTLDVRSYHYLGGKLQFDYMKELIRIFLKDEPSCSTSSSELLR